MFSRNLGILLFALSSLYCIDDFMYCLASAKNLSSSRRISAEIARHADWPNEDHCHAARGQLMSLSKRVYWLAFFEHDQEQARMFQSDCCGQQKI